MTIWQSRGIKKAAQHARDEIRRARRVIEKYPRLLKDSQLKQLKAQIEKVELAAQGADIAAIKNSTARLHESGERLLPFYSRSVFLEWVRTLVYALLIALCIRVVILEAFRIPSSSLVPTLLVGDQLIVAKLPYGVVVPWTDIKIAPIIRPKRGDIVVFRSHDPMTPDQNFIKRIVGVPGDRKIQLRDNELYIDGRHCPISDSQGGDQVDSRIPPTARLYDEDLLGKRHEVIYERMRTPRDYVLQPQYLENCGENNKLAESYRYLILDGQVSPLSHDKCELTAGYYFPVHHRVHGELQRALLLSEDGAIPPDYFFMMGDNRDNSRDSRAWGLVPFNQIKGKALFIYWSWGSGLSGARQLLRIGDIIH
ncbi:MAG: signal peptidase I [Candidatus Alcyoniella australis]|nr:signal peptidase I [Candidatus Alcyoniella australis]